MLSDYMNDSAGVIDLTSITNDNMITNEEENYICSDCNVALIEKLDFLEREDALDSFDNNEMNELRQHGMIIKDIVTITRSSVDGSIKEEHLEE
jgi:hypothetical protein